MLRAGAHTRARNSNYKEEFRFFLEIWDEIEAKGFSKSKNCILDNSKLKSLGWEGKYSLYEGLYETIEYLRDKLC